MKIFKIIIIGAVVASTTNASAEDKGCIDAILNADKAAKYSHSLFERDEIQKYREHRGTALKVAFQQMVNKCENIKDPRVQSFVNEAREIVEF